MRARARLSLRFTRPGFVKIEKFYSQQGERGRMSERVVGAASSAPRRARAADITAYDLFEQRFVARGAVTAPLS